MESNTYASPSRDPSRISFESHEMEAFHSPHHHRYTPVNSTRTVSRDLRSRPRGSWLTWWRVELLMSLLATAFMFAIVGILLGFHDRPISAWPYASFSLNSVIALLATGARTSLMFAVTASIGQRKWRWFLRNQYARRAASHGAPERSFRDFEAFDDSSRGWLGSLKFLGKIGLRDLAFIGAAITVLSLLFNTLTQNLVVTKLRTRPGAPFAERAGVIPRSTYYNNYSPGVGRGVTSPDLPTLAAIYTGMLSSNVSDIPVSCPTGNCTWPIVPSLGVCGTCTDVTSSLVHACPNSTTCQWSVPGGATLVNPSVAGNGGLDNYTQPTVFKVNPGPSKNWDLHSMVIQQFNVIGQSQNVYNTSITGQTPTQLSGVRASECVLWFCLQARHTNISFGITHQGVATTWDQAIQDTTRYSSSNFIQIPDNFNVEPGVVYGVKSFAAQAISQGIQDIIFGTVNPTEPGEIAYVGATGGVLDGLKGLWYAADDINGWMCNLTQSLSNNVRLTGTTTQLNSTLYDGVVWIEEVYIKVQWLWMIYPWALVVLSFGFLLITILENRKQRPWKNDAAAMLYTRLDDQLREDASKAVAQNRSLTEDFDRMGVRLHAED